MSSLLDALKRLETSNTTPPAAVEPFSDEELQIVRATSPRQSDPGAPPARLLATSTPNVERLLTTADTLTAELRSEFPVVSLPGEAAPQADPGTSQPALEPLPVLEPVDLLREPLAGIPAEPSTHDPAFFELTDNVFDVEARPWSELGEAARLSDVEPEVADDRLPQPAVQDDGLQVEAPTGSTPGEPDVVFPDVALPEAPISAADTPPAIPTNIADASELVDDPHAALLPVELRASTSEGTDVAADSASFATDHIQFSVETDLPQSADSEPAWEVTVDDEPLDPTDLDLTASDADQAENVTVDEAPELAISDSELDSRNNLDASLPEELEPIDPSADSEPATEHDSAAASVEETLEPTVAEANSAAATPSTVDALDPDRAASAVDAGENTKSAKATESAPEDVELDAPEEVDDTEATVISTAVDATADSDTATTEAEDQETHNEFEPARDVAARLTESPVSLTDEAEPDPDFVRLAGAVRHRSSQTGSPIVGFISVGPLMDRSRVAAEIAKASVGSLPGEVLAIDFSERQEFALAITGKNSAEVEDAAGDDDRLDEYLARTRHYGVRLLPVGRLQAGDALDAAKLTRLARQQFPLTLVDLGEGKRPIEQNAAAVCDAIYLVVRLGQTSREQARQAVSRLRELEHPELACIVAQ